MSYYGSEIEWEIEKIVRYWERRVIRVGTIAFLVGALLSWLLTSIVWDVMG